MASVKDGGCFLTVIGLYLGLLASKRYVGNALWSFPQLSYLNTNNNKKYVYEEL